MMAYYVRLAIKSIGRSKLTSVIVVSALGVGIGIAMAFVTILHLLAKDPLPNRSDVVFFVQLDNWAKDREYPGRGDDKVPTQVTYQDAIAVARSDIPTAVSVHYKTQVVVRPEGDDARPFLADTRANRADFFDMFEAPFVRGHGWRRVDDEQKKHLVVLSRRLSERLFGSMDSVGKTVTLAEQPFKVIGVLDTWRPSIRHYDMSTSAFERTAELFIPFDTAVKLEIPTTGNMDGWRPAPEDENLTPYERTLRSETVWLQMFVELPTPKHRADFQNYLENYIRARKQEGRFERPLLARLSTIPEIMERWKIVPGVTRVLRLVSLMFLVLCILSVVGLLLSSFLPRAHEVGLRRALGASRTAIFTQYLVESALLGITGGVLGIFVTFGIFAWIRLYQPPDTIIDFTLTLPMFGVAFVMAVFSGIAAGLYPAWRVCSTPPAVHLKA